MGCEFGEIESSSGGWGLTPAQVNLLWMAGGSLVTLVAQKALSWLDLGARPGQTSLVERVGQVAAKLPSVEGELRKEYDKQAISTARLTIERWAPLFALVPEFEPRAPRLPQKGWSPEKIKAFIDGLHAHVNQGLEESTPSGTIYNKELVASSTVASSEPTLPGLLAYAAKGAFAWNSLHASEFSVGDWLNYLVTQVVAGEYGAHSENVRGYVTTGGTLSLMHAAHCYTNRMEAKYGNLPGETQIIASRSIHAAVHKGAQRDRYRLRELPTDEYGRLCPVALERALEADRSSTGICKPTIGAIFISAPSYPEGVFDDVGAVLELAVRYGVPVHIDCCLGGFAHFEDYLSMAGVGSISIDGHKIVGGPKGSSLVITLPVDEYNLMDYGVYTDADWSGGPYGSPGDEGSRSCLPMLNFFLTMMWYGKEYYVDNARRLAALGQELCDAIESTDGLRLTRGRGELRHVIPFTMSDLPPKAVYTFAREMKRLGIDVSAVADGKLHFCLTPMILEQDDFINRFKLAAAESMALPREIQHSGEPFPGAGLYCNMETACAPTRENTKGVTDYMRNLALGKEGAKRAIWGHFAGTLNPYEFVSEEEKPLEGASSS